MTICDNTLQVTAPCDFERHAATAFKKKVLDKVSTDITTVEIELNGTRAFDSNGLNALMAVHDAVAKSNGKVRLINPSTAVTQLLEMTSLHRLFVIAKESAKNPRLAHRSILVVEDESIIRSIADMSLKPLGRPIVFAENGQEAIAIARRDNPAIILLDYLMPLMDGSETLRRLKTDAATKHIPVIIMSANERIAAGVYEKFEGASCFISKPFSPSALRGEVHRVIEESLEVAA